MEFKTATERLLYQGRTYHEMYFTKSMGLNEISKSVPWDTSESEIISVLQAYTDIVVRNRNIFLEYTSLPVSSMAIRARESLPHLMSVNPGRM